MSLPDHVSDKEKKQLNVPEEEPASLTEKQEQILKKIDHSVAEKQGRNDDRSEQEKNMESEGGEPSIGSSSPPRE